MRLTLLNLSPHIPPNPQSRNDTTVSFRPSRVSRFPSPESRIPALEAASPALLFGQSPDGYRSVGPYRGLGTALSARDLNPPMQARMQQVAYYLYLVNPLAHRIIEYTKNYVVGDGVTVEAEDPGVARVLERFWQDPVNRMDLTLPEIVKELSIFGEQCWLAAVNPLNGRVRLGYLDPAEIEAVEWGEITLPGASDEQTAISVPVAVWRRARAGEKQSRRFRIVRLEEDPDSARFGRLTGECFYFAINKVRSASRGISDLFSIGDYLDGYDQMLFGLIDRVGFANAFIWDVLLKGSTEEQITDWLKEQRPPRPGSVRAHNEQVEWKAVSPTLNAQDLNEAARAIKNINLAGAGFPEHWFAEGGNVNRATALEMGEPTLKTLLERQGYVAFLVRQVLEFVLDQAVAAGTLAEEANRRFTVQMPEMSVRDHAKAAQALSQVSAAVVELRRAQLLDAETAQKLIASAALQLGVEMKREGIGNRE